MPEDRPPLWRVGLPILIGRASAAARQPADPWVLQVRSAAPRQNKSAIKLSGLAIPPFEGIRMTGSRFNSLILRGQRKQAGLP